MKKLLIFLALLPSVLFAQLQLPLALQTPPIGTSHQEMIKFLTDIVAKSNLVEMESPSKTNLGREIPVVFCPKRDKWNNNNPTVMIFAQQHGNEPSGKEALLMILYEIHLNSGLKKFKNLNLILVPLVNADGNEVHKRRNNNSVDLNRNHVILTESETRLLHHLFEKYKPEVTLDVHEYGARTWLRQGFIKNLGEQLDCLSNPAIPTQLKQFAISEILDPTIDRTRQQGVKANRYLITRSRIEEFVRHSTTDINDGRNSLGIQYTLSFILEGMNGFSKSDRIWQRAKHQLTLIQSFLKICNEKSEKISKFVRRIRKQYSDQIPDSVVIQADYTEKFSRALTVNLVRTRDLGDTTIVLPDYRPHPEPILAVKRPRAYIIEKPTQQLLNLLNNQYFKFRTLSSNENYSVEAFKITGRDTLRFESRETVIPVGHFIQTEKTFSAGDVIIETSNLRAIQIVQIMEPQSLYGLSHYEEYKYVVEGKEYPVYRVIDGKK